MQNNQTRLSALQRLLDQEKIGCMLIGPTSNMVYLLGDAPHADERLTLLVILPDRVQMVVPQLSAEMVSGFTDVELLTWKDADGPLSALASSCLADADRGKVAVDGAMRSDYLLPVISSFSVGTMVSADPVLSRLRIRKDAAEIEALLASASLADAAMSAAVDACAPGVTEAEVAWAAEEAFRKGGAENVEFTLIASGPNAAFPHHHSDETRMERGHGIILDIGASLKGYKSDITRMVFLGEPDDHFRRAYESVRDANRIGREAIHPGMSAGDIDRTVRDVLQEAGLAEYFIHRTGHGLGLDVHEEPWIQDGSGTIVEEGMVFSIEPGVYLPGRFGIRVEDIVVVTDKGAKPLTAFTHALTVK